MAKLVNFPKRMKVAVAWSASTCFIHQRDGESLSLDTELENATEIDKNELEYSINAVHDMSPECSDAQTDRHNAVMNSNNISKKI